MEKKYNRILIKLSGEAIGKEDGWDIDNKKLEKGFEKIIERSKKGGKDVFLIRAVNI